MPISNELLKILVCPRTHEPLEHDIATDTLVCRSVGVRYRITEGIPVLLVDEAQDIEQ
jgi:uncharacterized protein YbaR (Trm112 family)